VGVTYLSGRRWQSHRHAGHDSAGEDEDVVLGHRDCDPPQCERYDAHLQYTSTAPFIHHDAAGEASKGRRGRMDTRCMLERWWEYTQKYVEWEHVGVSVHWWCVDPAGGKHAGGFGKLTN
jgi:hypothetical protein